MAAFALAALTGSCAPKQPPNLLLIAVDTLRFDHVGSYGATRDATPSIDALAGTGARFERAYATAPWTQPSVASILTGLHPKSHGVDRLMRILPRSAETLPEVLAGEGFETGCVVSHWLIGPKFGFQQGCDDFVHGTALGSSRFSTPGVTERAQELLAQYALKGRPFFLFVHYFDPHYEYRRHGRYGFAAERAGRLDGSETIPELRALDPPPDDEERRLVRDLYDEEVAFTDAGVGRLLATLDRLEVSERTVVVLVSDHGEEFFDRGWLGHTRTLYEEVLRVPLVIRPAGSAGAGRVVAAPVSLVGLMATLLDLLGVEVPGLRVQGKSFAALVRGEPDFDPGPVYAETEYLRHDPGAAGETASSKRDPASIERKRTLLRGHHKLVENATSGEHELYDLEADPGEQSDLTASRPELAAELSDLLERMAARALAARLEDAAPSEAAAAPPSEAEVRRLRRLGYLAE